MKNLVTYLNKMYKDAAAKYDEANIADYEEKEYQMGVMDAIEDVRDFINQN